MKTKNILREERVWATLKSPGRRGGPRVCVGVWGCGVGLAPSLMTLRQTGPG